MFGIPVDRGSVVLVEPPRDDSLSIRHEPSLPDRCQPPPVTSMAAVEEAAAQPDAPACLVKPAAAWSDFSGPTWDSPIAASVFNLQPRAGPVEPRRAQGWAQRDLRRSRTVIESGHWKAAGPGLRVLCSFRTTRIDKSLLQNVDFRRLDQLI